MPSFVFPPGGRKERVLRRGLSFLPPGERWRTGAEAKVGRIEGFAGR